MFENLQDRLERSLQILKGEGRISEINISETLKEVRRALIDADVNYKVAKQFTDTVKAKAMGQNVIKSLKPRELMLSIVRKELIDLMGGEKAPFNVKGKPAVILMSGLQGSGKTTFSAKLANKLKETQHRSPLLIACDIYRPAAIEQLKVLGEQIKVPVYSEPECKDAVGIAHRGIEYAQANNRDLVIIDTAGRLAIDEEMMAEIEAIKKGVQPQETLFVVDSMTGQDAVNTAREFNNRLDFDGVVLTKLDGDTRGGAALSIRSVVNKPIKFIGDGEGINAIEDFNPEGMASRIMGQGDIWSLAQKAQDIINKDEAERINERIKRNKFDFDDFLALIHKIKKMGNLKNLASMIPGVGKAIKDVDIDDNAFKSIEAIIGSMTPYERANPQEINASRRRRIAGGSGTTIQEVNRLLTQFEQSRKMMRMATQMKNPTAMMKQMRQARKGHRR